MPKSLTSSRQVVFLFIVIAFAAWIRLSEAAPREHFQNEHLSKSSDNEEYTQRRTYDLEKLRRFLLTSNAEQRAAKREKQDFHKRALIREYLQSINDPNRLEEVKKRAIYCSIQDILHGSLCRRRDIYY